MSGEQRNLPLFPLNAVLFPGTSIPLHIFEERYKLMVNHILQEDATFGVVLIREGSEVGSPAVPHTVGTVARIVDLHRVEDGRFFLSAVGGRRFRIREVWQHHPYLCAAVEVLEDEGNMPVPAPVVEEACQAFEDYVRALLGLRGGWIRHLPLRREPLSLSYLIASTLPGDLQLKQHLLELPTPLERLQQEVALLHRETERIRRHLLRKGWLGRISRN